MKKDEKANPEKEGIVASGTNKKAAPRTKGTGARKPRPKKEVGKTDTTTTQGKKKILYRVKFFYEWCKSCGICSALCPKNVILLDEQGRPYIDIEENCIGCRNCEIHCPDFAITVKEGYPQRRKSNGV